MTLRSIVMPIFLFVAIALKSQSLTKGPNQLFSTYRIIEIVGPDDPSVKGDAQLFKQSVEADIVFKGDRSLDDVWINFDLYHSQLILLYDEKTFSANFGLIDNIYIKETGKELLNSSTLTGLPKELPLLKLYESSHLYFFKKPELKIIKPSYNRELDIGTKDTKIVQEFQYLIYEKESQAHIFFKPTKNGIKVLDNYKDLKDHMKANNHKLDIKEDAIAIVQFYEKLKFK